MSVTDSCSSCWLEFLNVPHAIQPLCPLLFDNSVRSNFHFKERACSEAWTEKLSLLNLLQTLPLKVNCNVFTSWFLMIEFGPQNMVLNLFLKNLFSFSRYQPSKSGTSVGSILGFTRFLKIIIGKPSYVMSQVIKAPWSVQSAVTYVTAKQVETAKFDGFWKKLWFTVLLITA